MSSVFKDMDQDDRLDALERKVKKLERNANGGSNLLTELISQLPYDHPARMYYKNVEVASDKTFSSILVSLQAKLGKFDSKDIAEVTSTDTHDKFQDNTCL